MIRTASFLWLMLSAKTILPPFRTASVLIGYSLGWWENDFQYVKRTPPKIAVPRATQRRFGALVATCFGEYPAMADRRPDFESEFKRVFDAKDMPVDPDAFVRLATDSVAFPLAVGCAHLIVRPRGGRLGRVLFLLDPRFDS